MLCSCPHWLCGHQGHAARSKRGTRSAYSSWLRERNKGKGSPAVAATSREGWTRSFTPWHAACPSPAPTPQGQPHSGSTLCSASLPSPHKNDQFGMFLSWAARDHLSPNTHRPAPQGQGHISAQALHPCARSQFETGYYGAVENNPTPSQRLIKLLDEASSSGPPQRPPAPTAPLPGCYGNRN